MSENRKCTPAIQDPVILNEAIADLLKRAEKLQSENLALKKRVEENDKVVKLLQHASNCEGTLGTVECTCGLYEFQRFWVKMNRATSDTVSANDTSNPNNL